MLIRAAVLACALVLAGCKVDAIAPVNIGDIDRALSTNQSVDLTARLLLTFTSRKWCEDMGASLVVTLKSSGLDMTPVACAQDPAGTNWHGELRMPLRISLASGDAAGMSADLATLQVRSMQTAPDRVLLVLGLDAPRLAAARERVMRLPAAQGDADARIMELSVHIMLRNDRDETAILDVGPTTGETDARIQVPAGGTRTVSLSSSGIEMLLSEGAANLFLLDIIPPR